MTDIERNVLRVSCDIVSGGKEYAIDATVIEQRLPGKRLFEIEHARAVTDNGTFDGLGCMPEPLRADIERIVMAQCKAATPSPASKRRRTRNSPALVDTGGPAVPPHGDPHPLPKIGHAD